MGQPSSLQQQTSQAYGNMLDQGNLGQGVINAAMPQFQRNLQLGADTLRQAGPRFNSNTERLVANQGQQAMQDFNLFQANALQQGQQAQLAALAGASQHAGGIAGQQNQLISQLLGLSGQLGAGAPALIQNPGTFQNVMSAIGTLGPIAMAPFTGGTSLLGMGAMGGGAAPAPNGAFGQWLGQGHTASPGAFGLPQQGKLPFPTR